MSSKRNKKYGYDVDAILCPHCQESNPVKAYVCIHCYEVIHSKNHRLPWWKRTIRGNRAGFLMAILFCLISVILINRWLKRVEAHMNTIQKETQMYHESVQEFIKAKQAADTTTP